ncbi:MAG: hypothetical protein H6591_13395 [Flavobacteriales bacterium]|nr:hypothetical protein [Flavobacteriales bacterium]
MRGQLILFSLLLLGAVHAQEPATTQQAEDAVRRVVRHSGLVPNFIVRPNADVRTAIAFVKDRQRVIEFNPAFIALVMDSTRSDWGAVSILAHEIAHHLLGHTIDPAAVRPGDELACDRYSGFVLFGMGATLTESLAAMSLTGDPHGTRRHPPKHARLEAIRQGWEEARRVREGLPPEPVHDPDGLRYVLSFVDDANTYYADSLGRVLWFDASAQAIEFGEMRDTGGGTFAVRWMDEDYLVDARMAIWRRSTHGMPLQVGKLEKFAR